jgi:ArsR family transcriptional regulator
MVGQKLELIRENGSGVVEDEEFKRLVAFGQAISDPIRVRMLKMMAGGRRCCDLPDCGVPAQDQDAGICVCEFERYFEVGQSKVSYHIRKLREAGLVRERKRGRWSFYSLDESAARGLIHLGAEHLGISGGEGGRGGA